MKPKSVRVSTSELVILAVHDLEEKNPKEVGFTQGQVAQFMAEVYKVEAKNLKHNVQEALHRGAQVGIFSHKSGRYKLEAVPGQPPELQEGKRNREKLGALIVEVSNEALKRKRKKRSEVDVTHWAFDKEDNWDTDCYQLAKRRRGSKKSDDDDMAGFSMRFFE